MTEFEKFLNSKPMAYKKIDLERMPGAFEEIQHCFYIPKIIHVVGTNGKGTTGRFIAELLRANGFRVGHYSSPHIFKINERFWRDGEIVSDEVLEKAHRKLTLLLPKRYIDSLSYFEYTTLMALPIFNHLHWLVLEAGLGGEFDATNVFPKEVSVVTPIGFDHQSFLGNTIEEIASTKLRSIGKRAVIAKQQYSEIYPIVEKIAKERGSRVFYIRSEYGDFVSNNFATARKVGEILGLMNLNFSPSDFQLPAGRFQRVKKNIIVDVGHNLLSAERVLEKLKQIGWNRWNLVYNSFEDKPYREILELFRPYIDEVEIVQIEDNRIVPLEKLVAILEELNIPYRQWKGFRKNRKYLVFGSFRVVEEVFRKFQ